MTLPFMNRGKVFVQKGFTTKVAVKHHVLVSSC